MDYISEFELILLPEQKITVLNLPIHLYMKFVKKLVFRTMEYGIHQRE
jgi:hypothetical protein